SSAVLQGEAPLGATLAGSACAGYERDFGPEQARRAGNADFGAVLRWRPFEGTEIVPFWSQVAGGQHALVPLVYSDGSSRPPLYDVRDLATFEDTSSGWRTATFGLVGHQRFGAGWRLDVGLFRVTDRDRTSDVDEYLWLARDATTPPAPDSVYHVLDALPQLTSASTSGELRLVRQFGAGVHQHKLDLSVRGRSSERAFGGDTVYDLGWTTLGGPPATTLYGAYPGLPASVDETRQVDAGAAYEERWAGVGTLGVGILKSRYRRTLVSDGVAAAPTLATPWLASLRFTAQPGRAVTLYGSYLQGLEDSALAPYSATNRGEPPPATRTHQTDLGLRYAPSERLSLVAGAFDIRKVYFNLDTSGLYTALGTVRHRGLETSFAYAEGGLTLLAGGVWLRPHLERTVTEPVPAGTVPIGPVPLTLQINLDYAPPRWRPLAASLGVNRLSARVATLDNQATLPPLTTLNAGLRYETRLHGRPLTVRLDGANLTNAHGLHLSAVGQVVPEFGRRVMLTVTLDR
ncbi:MAG: hypothetical protein JSR54_16330, partial [Proteobacteria bacterium]|nr:hypothetical protein [Pseudomonadota bacterium]